MVGALPIERLLLIRLLLPPLYNNQLVKIKASIKLAIGRNIGNKDKTVRRRKKEVTRRNRQRITLSLTLKIVSGNKVVDLNDLGLRLPYIAYALT